MVLCVDEKTGIQTLERAQGWLRLPNGKALTGFNHEYKRHGTTTLFAALETATGLVKVGHYQRRRRREFLDFMNNVVAAYQDKGIHVILDNLNTHTTERGSVAEASSQRALSLYPDSRILDEPGGNLA